MSQVDMNVDPKLIEMLVCPETKQKVKVASGDLVSALNKKIRKRELKNRDGNLVEYEINGALIREDGEWIYLVREDIPVMIIGQAVAKNA